MRTVCKSHETSFRVLLNRIECCALLANIDILIAIFVGFNHAIQWHTVCRLKSIRHRMKHSITRSLCDQTSRHRANELHNNRMNSMKAHRHESDSTESTDSELCFLSRSLIPSSISIWMDKTIVIRSDSEPHMKRYYYERTVSQFQRPNEYWDTEENRDHRIGHVIHKWYQSQWYYTITNK